MSILYVLDLTKHLNLILFIIIIIIDGFWMGIGTLGFVWSQKRDINGGIFQECRWCRQKRQRSGWDIESN